MSFWGVSSREAATAVRLWRRSRGLSLRAGVAVLLAVVLAHDVLAAADRYEEEGPVSGEVLRVIGDHIEARVDRDAGASPGQLVIVTDTDRRFGEVQIGTWRVRQVHGEIVLADLVAGHSRPAPGMRVVIDPALQAPPSVTGVLSVEPVSNAGGPQVAVQPYLTPAPARCELHARVSRDGRCGVPGAVYVGPHAAQEHWGSCVSAGPCRLEAYPVRDTQCGPGEVYAGPADAGRHGGHCVAVQAAGYALDGWATQRRECEGGVYVGPNAAAEHHGTCLALLITP